MNRLTSVPLPFVQISNALLVVTADDVRRVPIFADLEPVASERLARAAADISLPAGEYAAHEGDEPALFALLDGRIEVVKLADGIERVVGERHPGDIIGEVPITFGTLYPVGFRAAEPTRVMRIEPNDYHAVAAVAPAIAKEVGRLASDRITGPRGLEGITAEPTPPRAVVVGHQWDPETGGLRRFLHRNQISFEWLKPNEPEVAERWGAAIPGDDDLPTIRVIGGKTCVKPKLRRVAELLGLETKPAAAEYDTVIVGAGPAGLAAAVYGASEGLRTIAVEREAPGGQAGTSSRIENYLGFPSGVSGDELASRALQQARRLGAEILVTRAVMGIDASNRQLVLDDGDKLQAETIILACGVSWRQLSVEGFDRLVGKGVYYGAARSEAPNTHGLDVHIVGAGNSAGQAALFFANYARNVTMLVRGATLAKTEGSGMSRYLIDQLAARANVHVLYRTEVVRARGSNSLEAIDVRNSDTGDVTRLDSGGLFLFIGADAETNWLPSEIALDGRGYVLTGPDVDGNSDWRVDRDRYLLETSVPGIFACGDVRSGPVKRVSSAVGEGSLAIAFVQQHLRQSGAAGGGPAAAG
jgi:thioredoxin reductase (NADPH)